tara:strand:- start:462 stop:1343 length:882 start_codon:yes stop_codon:yes gene_type:complete
MKIVIYANCQGIGISYFLKKSIDILSNNILSNPMRNSSDERNLAEFCRNSLGFEKISHIRIDDIVFKKSNINYNLIKNADIFIYQPLDDKHGNISTNSILKLLKPECKKISFPYIYNNSFYPVIGPLVIKDSYRSKPCSVIFNNSEIITDLIDKKYNLNEILKLYQENKINFNYQKRWDYTNNILKEKEKNCDVKIVDFIKNNFSKQRLFLLENHPTSIIFINVVNQILEKLEIPVKINPTNYNLNDANLSGGLIPLDDSSNNFFNYEFNIEPNNYQYYKQIITNIYNFYTQK